MPGFANFIHAGHSHAQLSAGLGYCALGLHRNEERVRTQTVLEDEC